VKTSKFQVIIHSARRSFHCLALQTSTDLFHLSLYNAVFCVLLSGCTLRSISMSVVQVIWPSTEQHPSAVLGTQCNASLAPLSALLVSCFSSNQCAKSLCPKQSNIPWSVHMYHYVHTDSDLGRETHNV
jgi:hypothetical protein